MNNNHGWAYLIGHEVWVNNIDSSGYVPYLIYSGENAEQIKDIWNIGQFSEKNLPVSDG